MDWRIVNSKGSTRIHLTELNTALKEAKGVTANESLFRMILAMLSLIVYIAVVHILRERLWGWRYTLVVEHLPGMPDVLGPIST